MKPVQALFFDLDNTLFDDDACVQVSLHNVHAEVCASLPGVDAPALARTYLSHSDPYWRRQPYARGDLDAVRRQLWR